MSTCEETAESRLAETVFIVEATNNERNNLWSVWAKQSDCKSQYRGVNRQDWSNNLHGWIVIIGTLDGMPVSLEMSWNRIDGQLVMFWTPSSQVVDHRQIDEWLEQHFTGKWDGGTRRAATDACNFYHAAQAIEEANNG